MKVGNRYRKQGVTKMTVIAIEKRGLTKTSLTGTEFNNWLLCGSFSLRMMMMKQN